VISPVVYHNSLSRYITIKEEHAEKAKHEIRVIWGDYIKDPHVEKHPELPGLVHKIMQLGSKCRQTADRDVNMVLNLLKRSIILLKFSGIQKA